MLELVNSVLKIGIDTVEFYWSRLGKSVVGRACGFKKFLDWIINDYRKWWLALFWNFPE